jgi:hypothetical protein
MDFEIRSFLLPLVGMSGFLQNVEVFFKILNFGLFQVLATPHNSEMRRAFGTFLES